jgi:hypothetical protein
LFFFWRLSASYGARKEINEGDEGKIDMRMVIEACVQCERKCRTFMNTEQYQLVAADTHTPLAVTKYGLHICLTEN